jgi:photosystem II stability/assembly factor-like uncharacterized protein
MMKMKRIKITIDAAVILLILSICSARGTVPPPASAYVQEIAIDYSNSDIVYVATIGAGLFKSENGAHTWQEINASAGFKEYFVVRLDPADPSRLFSGGTGTGLWLSDDKGENWLQIGLQGITICDIAIDPTDSRRIFVLAPDGVYRNRDITRNEWEHVFDYGGFLEQNWKGTHPDQLWQYSRFQKIAINPHNPMIIFLGARWEGGYHRSDDGGDTWGHHWISGIFRRVDPILFHPEDPDIVYAGTHHQGLFKSFNGGISWISYSIGIAPQIRSQFYGAYLISGIVFEPGNPEVMYTGSDFSNWKTRDGGLSWQELGKTLTCEFARSFAVDPIRTDVIYAGTNVGMYKSYDAGETWISVNRGFPPRTVKQILPVSIDGEDFHYALVLGRPAVYRRPITGNTDWISMSWLLYADGDSLGYDPAGNELILYTKDGEIRSTDGGFRWNTDEIQFATVVSPVLEAPVDNVAPDIETFALDIEITGDVFFDDSLVDPLYRRPPYVSLQLVTDGYPCDNSVPVWEKNFERHLKGTVYIPRTAMKTGKSYMLYAEVRDFQRNTLVGFTQVTPEARARVRINISPKHYPPCIKN